MGLFGWLGRVFGGGESPGPEDADPGTPPSASPEEVGDMLARLHESNTRNEVQLRQVKRELDALEHREASLKQEMRSGDPDSFAVRLALQELDRLIERKKGLLRKADIFQGNLNYNAGLIREAEMLFSMAERSVSEEERKRLEVDVRERFATWRQERMGEASPEAAINPLPEVDRQRLEKLEIEVLGKSRHYTRAGERTEAPAESELREMVESAEKPAAAKPAEKLRTEKGQVEQ